MAARRDLDWIRMFEGPAGFLNSLLCALLLICSNLVMWLLCPKLFHTVIFPYPHQVVVIPCGITASMSAEDRSNLMAQCEQFVAELQSASQGTDQKHFSTI